MTDKQHTYRVPVTGHAVVTVAADSAEEAQRIAPDYAGEARFSFDSDGLHRRSVEESEDEKPMTEAVNVEAGDDVGIDGWVDVPYYPSVDALVNARKNLGLTQRDVAEGLGVPRSTVGGWESERSISLEDARWYADFLRVQR